MGASAALGEKPIASQRRESMTTGTLLASAAVSTFHSIQGNPLRRFPSVYSPFHYRE